jgi:hypothetical protein
MKKTLLILPAVVLAGGAALWLLSEPGGLQIVGGDKSFLADRTVDFLEDIKFKDFKKAATYHLEKTQKERDIPTTIQRIFAIKHEVLDIQHYKILDVDLDRSQMRARVRAHVFYRVLGDKQLRDDADAMRDLIMLFYWFKQDDGSWAMELESSLR